MRTSGTIPPSLPTNADTASQSSNNNINTPEDPSSFPPEGFYILTGVVSEEAWEEIRVYLGLSTTGVTKSSSTGNPSIEIYGFCGNSNGDGHNNNNNNNNNHNQDDCGSDAATIAMTRTVEIPWESTPFPQNRPVAQFGFRYDYERDVVVVPPENDDDNNKGGGEETVPKIPDVFHHLLLRPYHDDIITKSKSGNNSSSSSSSSNEFTQCIVNVYRPSTTMAVVNESKSSDPETTATITATTSCSSIPWHVDDPQFGPEIIVFTFGETRPLHMRLKNEDNSDENDNGNDASNETKHSRNDSFSYFTAHPSHRSCYVLSGPARHKWQHSVPSGSGWRVSITFRTLRTTQ